MDYPVRVLASSLSGSEHVCGFYSPQKGEWCRYPSETVAREHLTRIGWTNLRFLIEEREVEGVPEILWDNQSVTRHDPAWQTITYVRGAPPVGAKISKSLIKESTR